MFYDGHSLASALYTHEYELYLSASSSKELIEILADYSVNSDYTYVIHLFNHYRNSQLGKRNEASMFQHFTEEVSNYNASGCDQVILQEYDSQTRSAFILCVITGLMS